jgi:hypothetical protein
MDAIVLTILSAYAVATVTTAWTHRNLYRPAQLWWFVVVLTTSFVLLEQFPLT